MSCSDLLTKFDDLVKRFTHEFKEIIEDERAKLKAELDEYNAEKQKMKAIDVSSDDIISLNVGGQKFTTTRSTLCQVEGSLLSIMFSGRWEDGLKRDQDGAVFFDFNPEHFGYILEYLRMKKIATLKEPSELPPDDLKNFTTLVEYLGLSDEMAMSNKIVQSERFSLHGSNIFLQDEGRVSAHKGPYCGVGYAIGRNLYKQGIVRLKLRLEVFEGIPGIFVGIIADDAAQQIKNNHSYHSRGSYGWALAKNCGLGWENGSQVCDDSLTNLVKQGDTVELVLDCNAGKLSLYPPTGHRFVMTELPKSTTWRLHANVNGRYDKLRIIND